MVSPLYKSYQRSVNLLFCHSSNLLSGDLIQSNCSFDISITLIVRVLALSILILVDALIFHDKLVIVQ